MRGKMFVISGPSGAGKSTVVAELLNKKREVALSISATTRGKRAGEEEGVNYYYKSRDEFEEMIKNNEFLEWAKYCDNYYGTPKKPVEKVLDEGKDIILEIEIQGAMQVKKNFPESIFIFIAPPSYETLVSRLKNRGTETEEVVNKRINTALSELKFAKEYDYILVNDVLSDTVDNAISIIKAEAFKKDRVINDLKIFND